MTIAMRGGPAEQPPGPGGDPANAANNNTGGDADPAGAPPPPGGSTDGVGPDPASDAEPDFPLSELARLEEMISRPRWVIPVLPGGELEVLLNAAIDLCKQGLDTRSEPCQRFFRDGLTTSFTKILTDDAVSGWKFEIHKCISKNCERLIELCVTKLNDDWFCLLDLLAMVFNPQNKFHTFNSTRASECGGSGGAADEALFARPPDPRMPRGWLVDLINLFGSLGGFRLLLERFQSGRDLTVVTIYALIRPVGMCHELLTVHTIEKFILPIVEIVPIFLEKLSDDELKKEAKNEAKNDALSSIVKLLKGLAGRAPGQEDTVKSLEMFRLKMILRLLQISSFNGKMNALNEVNKVIGNMAYYSHGRGVGDDDEWLTADKMAEWIKENKVLQIVLRDSLHQPQYVEKLEKIIRFIIKEKALTLEDLDSLWAAQSGKHEAIVKNVHDLLAKLAWDFSPEQLDHLFGRFQASWANATKKQRERLLELIRRLAEDDKDGVMAHKVLNLLWSLAHSDDVPTEIMDQALSAHMKILDYSCSQDRDAQKTKWLDQCVEELKSDKWVLPTLKQIRDICCLYQEAPPSYSGSSYTQRNSQHGSHRHEIINQLQSQHSLVVVITENLTNYVERMRVQASTTSNIDVNTYCPDGRYNHMQQIQERLNFLRFLLKDGQLWLCAPQAHQIWSCLAERAVFPADREVCFKWFSKLMGDEPDLDPNINQEFFRQNILQLDPALLTESGIRCFDKFFKAVNQKAGKLVPKRRTFLMEDEELIGLDYIWRVVMNGSDEIANKAIELLREIYTNLGPQLQTQQKSIHADFISNCMDRLRASYDTLLVLERERDSSPARQRVATTLCRVLKVLREYIVECDKEYGDERVFLPLFRAYRGKHLSLVIRLPAQGRSYDFTVESHTQETLASVRRHVLHKVKASPQAFKVELFINGETLDHAEDKKCVGEIAAIRDETVLTAKLCSTSGAGTAGGTGGAGGSGGGNMPSSPDSSSDSSAPSPQHPCDGPNVEAENALPGLILSQQEKYVEFLLRLSDLGCRIGHSALRDAARCVLQMAPAGRSTMDQLQTACQEAGERRPGAPVCSLEGIFFSPSPAQVLYSLEVLYSLLMPAEGPLSDKCCEFHRQFLKSGGGAVVLDMLNKNNFLSGADLATRRLAFLTVLRLTKLVLSTVGFAAAQLTGETGDTALQQAVILPSSECMLRNVAIVVAQKMGDTITSVIPELSHIQLVMKLVWAASRERLRAAEQPATELRRLLQAADSEPPPQDADQHDLEVCREGLETFSVALCLRPDILEALTKEVYFQDFVMDLVLICRNRVVRVCAAEQFSLIAMRCSNNSNGLIFFINLLFSMLNGKAKENASNSQEYFQLLCRLLECACHHGVTVPGVDKLLQAEIAWLQMVKERHRDPAVTEAVDELLMEGHLRVTRELLNFLTPDQKLAVGSDAERGGTLVTDLLENFLLSYSVMLLRLETTGELPDQLPPPICYSAGMGVAAFDVLVALCTGCVQNLRLVVDTLIEMYYSDREEPITEWEYAPPVPKRPAGGFVGLKNAGATCYMNSVLQQLYMIERVRSGVLAAEGACTEPDEDFSGEERADNEIQFSDTDSDERRTAETQREYNVGILKWLQAIFGHLAGSKLQYYIPRGLWKHFKLQGEPVNLREQHDAIEFFISLVDSVDEALKALQQPLVMSRVLGGIFSDQKICKQCPHRYSKEDPFTVLNVDIRNFTSLTESLDQYVKGDLLEGANAYHCDKCNRKVDTVKRTCIKKLPPTLCIQLKRFDYDWERECAIKFNDYFEFPRQLDMEPYTVRGLARIEGELIDGDPEELTRSVCSSYELTGIVVHSGQASGGHYYSYILHRNADGGRQWYKFDDYDVSECRMEDDEEMRTQCFGGEYVGEVFDQMMKRMSSRRQKRWWNAYILFYTRADTEADGRQLAEQLRQLSLNDMSTVSQIKMPAPIQRSIRRQNIRFMHTKNQFFIEFVQFIRKLVGCNSAGQTGQPAKPSGESEQTSLMSVQLAVRFLFTTGLHMKKVLRGPTCEWYEALLPHLTHSAAARAWLAHHVLFVNGGSRFCEYLLECPSSEVRSTFAKLLVLLARHSTEQPAPSLCPPPPAPETNGLPATDSGPESVGSLSEAVVHAVLSLLKKDVAEHGRHLPQYFSFFLLYAAGGLRERTHLLKLQIPATLMLVALEEGPGPPIKFQYADLSKLYQAVALLVRCCDISAKMTSAQPGAAPLPNPHGDPDCPTPIMPIQPAVDEILFSRASYLKKIIEDAGTVEETGQLLRYCSWENPAFSSMALAELLWQISYSYNYELRPYLDLLLQLLLVEDSWQTQRILNALKGNQDEREGREGLFDTIQRFKNHYQKRAYQCIKCLVELFSRSAAGQRVLHSGAEFRRKWYEAVDWLKEELDRRPFQSTPQYGYTWSPPTQSNETSNGYFLERSHSALMCLEKADELCPEEPEGDELEEESQRSAGGGESEPAAAQPPPPPPPAAQPQPAAQTPPQPPTPAKPASFKPPDANDN